MNRFVVALNILRTLIIGGYGVEEESGILILNKLNFQSVILHKEPVVVKFYAPYCIHCKMLSPEYIKAAEILAAQKVKVKMAQVNAVAESSLAKRYDVMEFPTMKFFKQETIINYEGRRTADDIVAWVLKHQKL